MLNISYAEVPVDVHNLYASIYAPNISTHCLKNLYSEKVFQNHKVLSPVKGHVT